MMYLLTATNINHKAKLLEAIEARRMRVVNDMPGSIQIIAEGSDDDWIAIASTGLLEGVYMAGNEESAWLTEGEG